MLRLAARCVYVKERATDYTDIKAISADQEVSVSSVAKYTLSNSVVYQNVAFTEAIIGCCFISLYSLINPKLLC